MVEFRRQETKTRRSTGLPRYLFILAAATAIGNGHQADSIPASRRESQTPRSAISKIAARNSAGSTNSAA